MKTKIFSLILLTTILLATIVSAVNLIDVTKSTDFSKAKNETSFEIKNIAGGSLNLAITQTPTELKDSDNRKITVSFSSFPTAINTTATATVTASIVVDDNFDFTDLKLGSYLLSTITVNAMNQTNSSISETETLTFNFINGFCKYGEVGKLEITELKDKEVDNEDSWIWAPFDNVGFSVEVYNGLEDKEKVKIKYELHDSNGKKVDFGEEDDEQSVSIDDGDSEKVTFSIKVPTDIDDGDYDLYIKAYLSSNEEEGCIDKSSEFEQTYYQRVRIEREEDRAVIVDKNTIEIPDFVQCGDIFTISPKIYNIGVEDEDKVKVALYNKELGVDLSDEVNDLQEGESATVNFNFKVPENAQEKTYAFNLLTFYEYDEDDDEYDSNSRSDLDEDFDFSLKVNCVKETQQSALITADLESSAIAGEQLLVKGTIKNTGEVETVYSLSVTGYSSWATLENVNPSTITLNAGESEDFDVSLNINEDVEEKQFFTITASYNGKSTEQKVSVITEANPAVSGITGAVISDNIKKNWFIWMIVVINIILITAIIVVARRIVKSR